MIRSRISLFYLVLATWLVSAACSPRAVPTGGLDEYGCPKLPPDTFTSAQVDVSSRIDAFQNLMKGEVDVKSDPRVLSLASQAARDSFSRDKIRCLAMRRDKYTPAQAMHLDDRTAFLSTNPNPDQYLNWSKMNPFPETADEQMKVLEREVEKLREEMAKSSQELHALQERTKDRRITIAQLARMATTLKKGEKDEIEINFVMGNAESERFAKDIGVAVRTGGWAVMGMHPFVFLDGTPVGLRIRTKDAQIPSVQTLHSALLELDSKTQVKTYPKMGGRMQLDVGSKP